MKLFHRIFGKQESLKACPFCGSKVEAVKGKGVLPIVAIRCLNDKCGADIMFNKCETDLDEAIERFNQRTVEVIEPQK